LGGWIGIGGEEKAQGGKEKRKLRKTNKQRKKKGGVSKYGADK